MCGTTIYTSYWLEDIEENWGSLNSDIFIKIEDDANYNDRSGRQPLAMIA